MLQEHRATSSARQLSCSLPLFGLILIFSLLNPAGGNSSAQQNDIREIKVDEVIEKDLSGGELHRYQIHLNEGQFLQVTGDQWGIDIVVALVGPDGKRLVEMDSPNGSQGPETVSWIAKANGNLQIEVSSLDKDAIAGRYQLKIVTLRAAVPQDNGRVAAQALFVEGRNSLSAGTVESLRKGIQQFEAALPLWRAVNDRQKEVHTLTFIASFHDLLGEYQKALEIYFPLLELTRAIGDRIGEADTLGNIGTEYYSLGENQKALDYYNQALVVGERVRHKINQSPTLQNIALVYVTLGDARRALDYYNQALPLLRDSGDRRGIRIALNNMGMAYAALGENQKALDCYNESLSIKQASGDRQTEGYSISNIGVLYESEGKYEEALNYYKRALEFSQSLGHRRGKAIALNNIGGIYNALHEGEKALEYLNEALPIFQALEEKSLVARVLNNIGLAYKSMSDYEKALDHLNRALSLMQEMGERPSEAQTLGNIGGIYDSLGEKRKAFEYFAQALSIRRATEDRRGEALTLNYMGSAATSGGDNQKALNYYNQALELSQAIKDRQLEIASLRGIARCERNLGHLAKARDRIEAALAIIETLRGQFASTDLRTSYFASVQEYYEFYIDLLMRLHESQPARGYSEEALEASERARARNLLELLAEARIDVREGVAPELLQRARMLQELLNSKAERQTQLLNRKHTDEQAKAFQKEIDELLAQYKDVEVRIRTSSPRYAALTQPQPLKSREIQERVLDSDTVLLEYALGNERSYLWAVTSSSVKSFVLPPRAEIEQAARKVYELLTTRNRRIKFETAEEKRRRIATADVEYWQAATALSRTILNPAIAELGRKRLIVVSDGALNYIPFAALPSPRSTRPGPNRQQGPNTFAFNAFTPLIIHHEIVNLPSASTLDIMRSDTARVRTHEKMLAVIADPVFEKDDERVRRIRVVNLPQTQNGGKVEDRSREALMKSARELGEGDETGPIRRLPFTRREADEILSLVPTSQSKRAMDFEASRSTARSPDLAQYRFVHFATHGFINSRHPELSGIVLSLVNEQGEEQNGFLRANEIFNLKLPADLVVLSGCRTGLGKEIRGEGLLGLTRGFMYAGAARVLVSLWSVSDQASADLMARVYQGMLGKTRLRPSAALREAQIAAWKDKRWQAPYYWAAFVLQGEPR